MSIVRALDASHDWTFGKGRNNYLRNNAAIVQAIDTNLLSFLGDCFFAIGFGIDWFNLLGSKEQLALNLAVSAQILNTPGVTALLQLSIDRNAARALTIQYVVTTIYTGVQAVNATIEGTTNFLLTQGGDVITTQDGDPITVT